MVSRFPLWRCCDPAAFSPGLAASDGARSVSEVGRWVSDRAPVSLRPDGGVVFSCVPRFSSVGEVPPAPPRVLGDTVSCGFPPRAARGVVAAVACGLGDLAGEADVAGRGDLAPGDDEVAAGELAPAGEAVVPAVVAAPVVVVVPVVVVEPETPAPTVPALTP